jgi:imidazolonepropionase
VLRAVGIEPTLLGAHALPPEATSADAYVAMVCDAMIPLVAASRLATAVDAFCESIAFTPAQVAKVFTAARAHGLHVKLHADQLSNLEGAALAARFGALSADHLEHTSAEGVLALADAGTVAVLLPGAYYFMRETRLPPIDALRAAGVPLAVATDCNPGTAPLTSLLAAMNMAATLFRLTVDECMMGVTANAARALGRDDIGSVVVGKQCDLAIWDIERPAELVYRLGFNPLHARIVKGVPA